MWYFQCNLWCDMTVVVDLDSALYLSSEYKNVIDYHEVYLQEGL